MIEGTYSYQGKMMTRLQHHRSGYTLTTDRHWTDGSLLREGKTMRVALFVLSLASLTASSQARADICTEHGFAMGTPGYLDCWRYVNTVNQQNRSAEQERSQALLELGAKLMAPPQQVPTFITPLSGWCRTQWGAVVACR